MKVLLIKDDLPLGESLVRHMQQASFSVDWARDGVIGWTSIQVGAYSCIVLDLGLRVVSGLEIIGRMRAAKNPTPVIVIAADDDVDARLAALDGGADDFLVKPFATEELFSRIRAIVRRKCGFASATLSTEKLSLNLNTRELSYGGITAMLSAREYSLLVALFSRRNAILSRAMLEEMIYGWGEEVASNAVDVIIYGIRRKFGSAIIQNVRGLGWSLGPCAEGCRPTEVADATIQS